MPTPSTARRMYWHQIESPVGALLLAGDAAHLKVVHFQAGRHPLRPADDWVEDDRPFAQAIRQIGEYFAGRRRTFELALAAEGTAFQRSVWRALTEIPYGETRSYGQIAQRLRNPRACRAVGLANGANPLAIVVPCHRVIGADGSLTGFGGGLDTKRKLLALERDRSSGSLLHQPNLL